MSQPRESEYTIFPSGYPKEVEKHPFDPNIRFLIYGPNLNRGWHLPDHLLWIARYTDIHLNELLEQPQVFHGTRKSRLSGIISRGGMISFPEIDFEGRMIANTIYGTTNPVLAAHHAFYNGPEDTNRQRLGLKKREDIDSVVVLKIDINHPTFNDRRDNLTALLVSRFKAFLESKDVPAVEAATRLGNYIPADAVTILTLNVDLQPHFSSIASYLSNY